MPAPAVRAVRIPAGAREPWYLASAGERDEA
jgi:hypothetical protein